MKQYGSIRTHFVRLLNDSINQRLAHAVQNISIDPTLMPGKSISARG